jgi:probable rRNA maturation factor
MIAFEILEDYKGNVEQALLERSAMTAFEHQGVTQPVGLTIVITNDAQIHHLNAQFRGIDAATDVLAFPAGYTDPDSGILYLGDLVISYPRAQHQADASGHPVESELTLLVVHGVLHILGMDHDADENQQKMWTAQGEILDRLGFRTINPSLEGN